MAEPTRSNAQRKGPSLPWPARGRRIDGEAASATREFILIDSASLMLPIQEYRLPQTQAGESVEARPSQRRVRGPMVRPWTIIEKMTTT